MERKLSLLDSQTSSPEPIPIAQLQVSINDTPLAGPCDPLDTATLDDLIQRASPAVSDSRFSMSDIIKNPTLHMAARRELDGSAPAHAASESEVSSCLDGIGHEAEVERQRAAVVSIDKQVTAESQVNRDMATLVADRLESSKK